MPVEAAAVDEKHLLFPQEVQRELGIVHDTEFLGIDLGEDVEGCLGLDSGDAGDIVQSLVDELSLLVKTAAGNDVVLDALIAAQCGLHDGLGRNIGAKAHVGEHIDAINIVLGDALVAAEDHPAYTVAGHHVGLGQSAEGDTEQIRCQGCDGDMLLTVHDQTVVDLVGEDDQLVLPGDLDDLLQNLLGVQRTGGVIGVDDDDGLGAGVDLLADVGDVGEPLGLLVAAVVDSGTAGQGDAGGPQGVVGGGDQHLVAGIQQSGHREVDQLTDTVAGVDAVDGHIGDVLELGILHDGLPGGEDAPGV